MFFKSRVFLSAKGAGNYESELLNSLIFYIQFVKGVESLSVE